MLLLLVFFLCFTNSPYFRPIFNEKEIFRVLSLKNEGGEERKKNPDFFASDHFFL